MPCRLTVHKQNNLLAVINESLIVLTISTAFTYERIVLVLPCLAVTYLYKIAYGNVNGNIMIIKIIVCMYLQIIQIIVYMYLQMLIGRVSYC